jgi:putative hydrolase of the HAD superfamily
VNELEELVADLDLRYLVDRVWCSASIGFEKPRSRFFESVASDLGIAPIQAVMVGDSFVADVIGVRGARIPAIWVRRPNIEQYRWHAETLFGAVELMLRENGEESSL